MTKGISAGYPFCVGHRIKEFKEFRERIPALRIKEFREFRA
jgi:hypothetical protein